MGFNVAVKESIGKLGRIKGPQIIDTFADTDPADRYAQGPFDRQDNTALGRAIELRQDDARQGYDFAKELGLADGVLAGRRIEDEERFLRCTINILANSSMRLALTWRRPAVSTRRTSI
jgi:hypothetical protein